MNALSLPRSRAGLLFVDLRAGLLFVGHSRAGPWFVDLRAGR